MMLARINYTEKDAEFDSELVFHETEDLDTITAMGNSLLSGQESGSGQRIHNSVLSHLRNVRYSKFAREALRTELDGVRSETILPAASTKVNTVGELTPEEFKQRLRKESHIYAVEIPNVSQMISDAGLVRVEASMKQLKKDIERDRLLVNGIRMVGAEAGLDAILSKICGVCDTVHTECGMPKLSDEVKEFVVLSLLSKASRSHSGGIAFQAAQCLIDPATAMLMPQSAVAPPLKINIYLGAFPTTRSEVKRCKSVLGDANAGPETGNTACSAGATPTNAPTITDTGVVPSSSSSSSGSSSGRWGLVCKITGESIFKVQLYDTPAEEGYDDCSTAELEGEDGALCMFRPVSVPCTSLPGAEGGSQAECSGRSSSSAAESSVPGDNSSVTPGSLPSPPKLAGVNAAALCSRGICLEGRNTFVSVIYEDYVLFEVKLSPAGELGNLANLRDDWKETATVTVKEVEPVRTLL
jgi:hypothetical protein